MLIIDRDEKSINVLNKRIDLLEQALQGQAEGSSTVSLQRGSSDRQSLPAPATTASQTEAVDLESMRYGEDALAQEVRNAKDFSLSQLGRRGHLAEDSPLSHAIDALDGVLAELGDLTEVISNEDPAAILTKDEAKEAVRAALNLLADQCFMSLVELDFMISLSEIITSPHVHIDPAARLVYCNLVFHGYMFSEGKTRAGARTLYLQCLVAVPPWQESVKGTLMDLAATSILTWTTVVSFDYNLAWKFHCMGCRIAKQLGLHHLDVLASKDNKEDFSLRKKRSGFWQIVITDLFFRLCYEKPSAISAEASPTFVKIPEVVDLVYERPRAARTVTDIFWTRVTFIAKTFFEELDQARKTRAGIASSEFQSKVDELCDEIEEMINDWHLILLMQAQKDKPIESWQYADTIIGGLNIVLQMDKLRQISNANIVSARSVRAARVVLDATDKLDQMTGDHKAYGALNTYCIAFYPFRAFFSLYYHILNSKDAMEYREDIRRLERVEAVMDRATQTRFEYIPISKAISSLNQVVKHIQQMQVSSPQNFWQTHWQPAAFSSSDPRSAVISTLTPDSQDQHASADATSTSLDYQPLGITHSLPDFGDLQFSTAADLQHAAAQPDFQGLEYMQAIETQFTGGNWHYNWWDVNDDANIG